MPSASNMRQLEWDDDLAAVAQKWADQCSFDHDEKPNKYVKTYEKASIS